MTNLNIQYSIPDAFLDISYRDIKKVFDKPTLIYLQGDKTPALFVSILLHGNEFSSLEIMQEVLKKYKTEDAYNLPRSLWLFVGNVDAAERGVRAIDGELDFNRAWPGTLTPQADTAKLTKEVIDTISKDRLFASVDLHNNTGQNPYYGCISNVNEENKHLCTLFNHIALVFKSPKGISTMAFDTICPAITLECSTPGNKPAIEKAFMLIDDLMHMDHFPKKPVAKRELQLVTSSATIKINPHVSFCFDDIHNHTKSDLTIVSNFEHHNFTTLEEREIFAFSHVEKPLIVTSQNGEDITDEIIQNKDGNISLKKAMMPAMITMNKDIILQDCLCYLLEDYK